MRRTAILLFLAVSAILSARDLRSGYYRGHRVVFENVDGLAIFEGDMILGDTAEIERARPPAGGKHRESSTTSDPSAIWPNATIPYEIDGALGTRRSAVQAAIDHWNQKTPIRLVARGNETNYVSFTTGTSKIACSSAVGMVGGKQSILLPAGCGTGEIIHEIGHAVGLRHEQQRDDRNQYVTVLYENIDKGSYAQFDNLYSTGNDAGPYDLGSIMHYGPFDFSRDGIAPAMESVPAGIPVGQRTALSAGDIDSVRRLYGQPPSAMTIATVPSGLKVLVDGASVDDGTSFSWAAGSQHTLEAPFQGDSATHHLFGRWSDGGAVKHTITASPDTTVYTANFIRQFKLAAAVSPAGSGTVKLDPAPKDGFYTDRSCVTVLATPSGSNHFVRWNVTGGPTGSNPLLWIMPRAGTLRATFTAGPVTTITSDPAGRTVDVDAVPVITPASFAWPAGESHTISASRPQQEPFEQYNFQSWQDGSTGNLTIQASSSGETYTAKFLARHTLTTIRWFDTGDPARTANSIAVAPSSPDGFYDEGTQVQVTAKPTGGYNFLRWTGDLRSTAATESVTIDRQKSVAASFVTSPISEIVPLNAATLTADPVDPMDTAPGEIISIFGTDLGPAQGVSGVAVGGKVTTKLAGVRVLVDDLECPLVWVSSTQINAIVPYRNSAPEYSLLSVEVNGRIAKTGALHNVDTAPGVFTATGTGIGQGAILNDDSSYNSSSNPARRGSVIVIYATGDGLPSTPVITGQLAVPPYPQPALPVSVRIGGQPAAIQYAGAAPGYASLMQINAVVPDGIRTGADVPVLVIVGDTPSQLGVTAAIR